jgi:eukaryotic-like serine/threonine-protein kinase
MVHVRSDRNLLFGIIALQMGFITRDALIDAMNTWVLHKDMALGEILVERGALAPADRSLLEPLVRRHVEQHGGDSVQSLASLTSVEWIRGALEPIARLDRDLQNSLTGLTSERSLPGGHTDALATDPGPTPTHGSRYRIVRLHAKGGLGEVFVARDAELHREVALKQIQDRHRDHPESQARFIREAEITGGLEHPGIVPVYGLGADDDGRPFYAMRLIKGDSLKEAIDQFHQCQVAGLGPGRLMLELQKLLRRFLDVCDAITYAHSRGVLHRDIKPGNIMVGQYGETLVVDWGLAKVVGRPETSGEATLRPPSASGSSETLPGSAMGTPAFMSPEQAEGNLDRLGPASDIYSLGATLYCILTGKAPIEGSDHEQALRRVQRGDFAPPRQVKPDVPRPLDAICLKAMALKPEDRYSTPRALADDIERWLADEPVTAWREPISVRGRRWMRRHRTAVAVAVATGTVALAALGIGYRRQMNVNRQLGRANAQLLVANAREQAARAESDRRLDQTLQAIESYYTGASEEVLLGQKELQPLRRRLLEKPRQFYEQLGRDLEGTGSRDLRALSLLARGRMGLGRIASILGEKPDARTQYEAAIALYRQLIAARPDDLDDQYGLAKCYTALGVVQSATGDLGGAAESLRQAVAIGTKLTAARPAVADFQYALAGSHGDLGTVWLARGDLRLAGDSYGQAIPLFRKLTEAQPKLPEYQRGLARVYLNLGGVQQRLGKFQAAASSHGSALAINTGLTKDRPDEPENLNALVVNHTRLGIVQGELGDTKRAAESHRQAIAIGTKLTAAQPNVPDYQNRLAASYNNLGLEQRRAGDAGGAVESYRLAVAIATKLATAHSDVPDYQFSLATWQNNLGLSQTSAGDPGGAAESCRQATAILTQLVAAHPDVPRYQTELANCQQFLGLARRQIGDPRGAADSFRLASQLFAKLTAAHPEVPANGHGLAASLGNLALAQRDLGDLGAAAEAASRALVEFTRLATLKPAVPAYQEALAQSHTLLGTVRRQFGDLRGADESSRAAIAIASKLVAGEPSNAQFRSVLAEAFHTLGLALDGLSRSREAEEALRQAIDHQRLACARAPTMFPFRRALSEQYVALARMLGKAGRGDDAIQLVRARRGLGPMTPNDLYDLACVLSLGVPHARDVAQRQSLTAEAIDTLRAAVAIGWRNAPYTSRDPDLAPLRGNAEFRRLVAGLFDRAFPADPFAR